MTTSPGKFIRLKAKCLRCRLHFVVCTEFPDRHSRVTLYCPECGQHSGDFVTYVESVKGEIWQEVPGNATLTPEMEQIGIGFVDPTAPRKEDAN